MIEFSLLSLALVCGFIIGVYFGTTNGYGYALSTENKRIPLVVRVEAVGDFFHANNYSDDMFLVRSDDLEDLYVKIIEMFPDRKVVLVE